MKRVLDSKLLDAAPANATATYIGDSLFVKPAPILIKSGLIKTPAVWLILPALPGCSPMDNPRQMIEGLTRSVGAIRVIDPDAFIMVCAAGRAAMYVATIAALMGLHIRIGMEDTYWLWPHRDDRIESNAQAYGIAAKMSDVVVRPVATPAEYRKMIGA